MQVPETPTSILLLVLWMDALARLGVRLVKDVLQLLPPQMERVQGRRYGGEGGRISARGFQIS